MSGNDQAPKESKGGKLAPGKDAGPRPAGPPWMRAEKPRNFSKAIFRLFGHIGPYRYWIYLGVTLSIISALMSTIGPKYLERITDTIADGISGGSMDLAAIGGFAAIILTIYLTSVILATVQHYIIPSTSERIANQLRSDLAHKIDRLPLNYYDNSNTGDIMSRVTNDADTIGENCGSSLSSLFTSATVLTGCAIMMFVTCPQMAVFVILPPVCGFILMKVIIGRTHHFYTEQSRNMGAMNGLVEETYYGHNIVRAYNGEEDARKRFVKINDDLFRSVFVSRFATSSMPQLMNFIGNVNYVLVCVLGSMFVIEGTISYGVIVAFIVYVKMFSLPLLQLSDSFASMQSLAASSERVFDLLDAPEMDDESHKNLEVTGVEGHIEFRDVSFSYLEGIEIIHHFSLDVKPGEKIAIVGPTGAGKTTIVNLLMRFYELDSGDILIDGVSTKDLRREQVHSMFSMVLQDAWLFSGTIRQNLKFNREVSDETMFEACRSVGIHDFVMSLPDGYDSILNDSLGMSAGQRQQLTIARAILHEAPMVIFDEATSSVDTLTEKKIQQAMNVLTSGKTSFIIAHRLTTIRDCDKIMVMRDGRIVEIGTHDELLEKHGFYFELYNSQFENCE